MSHNLIRDLTLEQPEMLESSVLTAHMQHPSERLFEAAFNTCTDAMMIIDRDYRIVAFNKSLEKVTGWLDGRALGMHCYEICGYHHNKTGVQGSSKCPLEGKKNGFSSNLCHTFTAAHGKRTTVSMTHARIVSSVYEDNYTLVVIHNYDKRKMAQRINDDDIAAVSHELLSPVNLIRGYASTLSNLGDTLTPEQRKRYLGAIESASFKLAQMLRNSFDLPRIEAEGLGSSREVTPLSQLVRRVVTEIQNQSVDNVITVHASRALPPVKIDRKKIEQVIANLLLNAMKYSPHGREIKVSIHGIFDHNDVLRIVGNRSLVRPPCLIVSVQDSGTGIPLEEIELIFEKYYRTDSAIKRGIQGAGIGLYICKVIVEGHSGHIWAKSKVGEGSTFYFSLPVGQAY